MYNDTIKFLSYLMLKMNDLSYMYHNEVRYVENNVCIIIVFQSISIQLSIKLE